MRSLVVLLLVAGSGAGALRAQSPGLTLTYLGNMGILLESGSDRIVIDGLHRGELADYAPVPPGILVPLEQAREPFTVLTAALTTHLHRDHFNAASVAARLAADSSMDYIAAHETVDTLMARSGPTPVPARVHGLLPPEGGEVRLVAGGAVVTVLDLPHNPTPTRRVANVGFLVETGGFAVLHVGDADPAEGAFRPHRLAERGVDVAVVPFWYLTGADEGVRQAIGARVWVASHVPPADTAGVRRQVLARVPQAIVLTSPGEHHRIPPRP